MCEEGHARRGQGGLCTLCGDEERKDSPGGWREGGQQGCSSERTEGVRPKRNYFRTSDCNKFIFPKIVIIKIHYIQK